MHVKKCPSTIYRQDSNPQPYKHEFFTHRHQTRAPTQHQPDLHSEIVNKMVQVIVIYILKKEINITFRVAAAGTPGMCDKQKAQSCEPNSNKPLVDDLTQKQCYSFYYLHQRNKFLNSSLLKSLTFHYVKMVNFLGYIQALRWYLS